MKGEGPKKSSSEGPKKSSKSHSSSKGDKTPTHSHSSSSSSPTSLPSSSAVPASWAPSSASSAPRGAGTNAVVALVRGLSLGPRDGAFLAPHSSAAAKTAADKVPNPYTKSTTGRRTSTGASTSGAAGTGSNASSNATTSSSANTSGRRAIARAITTSSDSGSVSGRSDKSSSNSDRPFDPPPTSSGSSISGSGFGGRRRGRGTQGSRSGDWESTAAAIMGLPAAMHNLVSPRGAASGTLSPPPVHRTATMPVGADARVQRKKGDHFGHKDLSTEPTASSSGAASGEGAGTGAGSGAGGDGTDSGSLAARRLRHRSVSSTGSWSGGGGTIHGALLPGAQAFGFGPVAEGEGAVEELQALLADERDRVTGLLARRDVLSGEARRVRGERDEARREQALLTERLAEMEGQMLALKQRHEEEVACLRRDSAEGGKRGEGSDSLAGGEEASLALGLMAVAEQVQVLRLENEGLRVELSGSARACRELAEEREAARLAAAALEREAHQLRAASEGLQRGLEAARARLEQHEAQADAALDRQAAEAQALRAQLEAEAARLKALLEDKERALEGERQRREAAEERERGASQALERERALRQEAEAREREAQGALEQEQQRRREAEEREGGVREALEGHQGLVREKVTALSREKAAAVAAGERRAASLQREMSIVLEQKEALAERLQRLQSLHHSSMSPDNNSNRDSTTGTSSGRPSALSSSGSGDWGGYSPAAGELQGCTGREREREFSRALDVARLEVKRLRAQRDLMQDRMRALEQQGWGARGLPIGWFMPDCLVRGQPEGSLCASNACA